MKIFRLQSAVFLPRPLDEIFSFFADAGNLELLTPPSLKFQILTPRPIEMRVGTRIDYQLKIHRIPVRWQSEITAWDPPHRFVDQQRRGPYRLWIHEHLFRPEGNGTVVNDLVQYAVPCGWLVDRFIVAPDLKRIFGYRHQKLQEIFGREHGAPCR